MPSGENITDEQNIRDIWLALLDLFSVVDDCATEDDLFDPAALRRSWGRCYRAWKRCRGVLDPEWDPNRWGHRIPRYLPNQIKKFEPHRPVTISPRCSTGLMSMTGRNLLMNALRENSNV